MKEERRKKNEKRRKKKEERRTKKEEKEKKKEEIRKKRSTLPPSPLRNTSTKYGLKIVLNFVRNSRPNVS